MLTSALLALVASAVSVAAAPGLSLKVTGPDAVNGVDNLHLTTELTNTGDETLKLLNDPRTILRQNPTNSFAVVHDESGASPAFAGVKVKYTHESAVKYGQADAFTTLAPGASVSFSHDLSKAYNFTGSGEGRYSFEPGTLFHYVTDAKEIVPIHADLATAHSAVVSGKLAVAPPSNTKRATYNGCSSSQQTTLTAAANAGNSYASSAYSYANSISSGTTRYTTWFGTYTASRHTTITSHYQKISSHDMNSYKFDCTCTDSGTYAYVYPGTFGTVYLCPVFWQVATTGTDSRGGTLVHESSHFTTNGGTDDYVYGQTSAKSLAKSNPDEAVFNADNHEYFAENNPAQS